MSLSDELSFMSAAEMARKIRQRELSPVEIVDATIARIEKRNPSITAFVFMGFDDARKAAKAAEKAVMAGDALGALHGVPSAIKDLFDYKPGWKSSFGGIRACKDMVSDSFCPFAERFEKAGAIFVGKTNSPVFGFRGVTDNYLFGPSRNPFNTAKNTGGSSGGSGGAVADGLVPVAEGTDGGGSIRIPSSWCGIFGYKPSFGRTPFVGRPNAFGGTAPFLHEGPMTRTVEDGALAMSVLAGYDPRDPYSLDDSIDFMAATRRSIRGWKIAYSPNFDIFPVDKRVADVVAKAVKRFQEAGAHVDEVKIGIKRSQAELSDLWCRLIAPLNIMGLEQLKRAGFDILKNHRGDLPPEMLHWVEVGSKMTAIDHLQDQAIRAEIYDAVQAVFEKYDLLVTPTLACLPPDNAADGNTLGPAEINGEKIDRLIGWCITYMINYTGHPAATVPAGLSPEKLPVGMQIVGRRYADGDVFAASAAFERLQPWRDSYRIPAARAV